MRKLIFCVSAEKLTVDLKAVIFHSLKEHVDVCAAGTMAQS